MKKRIWVGLLICLVMLSGGTTVNAYERALFKDFVAGGEADNEKLHASVNCATTGKSMDISFQTTELSEKTYSTVTAYKSERMDIDTKGSVMVGVANMQNQAARMNFSVIDEGGSVFQVQEGCYVALCDDQMTYAQVVNGCFDIPAGFSGELEIPFPVMEAEQKLSGKITGYGFVCVSAGQSRYHLKFYDMNFLDESEAVDAQKAVLLKIIGEEAVRKPETGFSTVSYTAAAYNMLGEEKPADAEFSISGKSKAGVSVTKDGLLKVLPEADEEVVLYAKDKKQGLWTEATIKLERSWTTLVLTENGYDASIAKAEDVPPIIDGDIWEIQEEGIWIIRGVFVAGVLIFFVYYAIKRRKLRKFKEMAVEGEEEQTDSFVDTGKVVNTEEPKESKAADVQDIDIINLDEEDEKTDDVVPEITGEIPEDIKEDVSKDLQQDIEEEVQKNVPEDIAEEMQEDIVEEIQKDVPEEIAQEVQEKIAEEIQADVAEEVHENVPEDIQEETEDEKQDLCAAEMIRPAYRAVTVVQTERKTKTKDITPVRDEKVWELQEQETRIKKVVLVAGAVILFVCCAHKRRKKRRNR